MFHQPYFATDNIKENRGKQNFKAKKELLHKMVFTPESFVNI